MKNIEIIWSESPQLTALDNCAERVKREAFEDSKYSLDLDVAIYVKKTTLSQFVDYLSSDLLATDNKKLKFIKDFISWVVLFCLSPKSSRFITSEKDEYRELFSKFKKSRGEWSFKKKDVEGLNLEDAINRLVREKLLEEDNDCYYVVGFTLQNLELNF